MKKQLLGLLIPLLLVGCSTTPPLQTTLVQPPRAKFPDSRLFQASFAETWDAALQVVGTRHIESANPDTGEIVTTWTESTAQRPLLFTGGAYAHRSVQRQEPVRERSQLRLHVARAGPEQTQVQVMTTLQYFPHWEKSAFTVSDPSAWKQGSADPQDAYRILGQIQEALAQKPQATPQAAPAPPAPGWIGVHVQSLTPDLAQFVGVSTDTGVLVREVIPESPAAQAGLQRGDVILTLNKQGVQQADDLSTRVAALHPGETVEVSLLRAGQNLTTPIVVGREPSAPQAADTATQQQAAPHTPGWIGVEVQKLTPELAQFFEIPYDIGVLVKQVTPDSPAAQADLRRGDVLLKLNQHEITQAEELSTFAASLNPGDTAEVSLLRDGHERIAHIVVGREPSALQTADTTPSAPQPGDAAPAPSQAADTVPPPSNQVAASVPQPSPQATKTAPRPPRAWLGATLQNFAVPGAEGTLASPTPGVLITEVAAESPAQLAGLRQGDILYALHQQPIRRSQDVTALLESLSPGTLTQAAVLREGKVVELKLVLSMAP